MKRNQVTIAVLAAISSFAYANPEQPKDTAELSEIVVTDRQGAKVKTNVVTLAEKNEHTETDLRGLLSKEPAIEFAGGNGTSQFLTIRGMGQNSVDIKVDGASSDSQILYHQGRFIIDPSLIKSVSVQKGAGSASAGIGATNGAIIVKTVDALDLLKNSDRDYGFKLNSGYSSNDGHSYGATVFGKAGNFDALLSFNRNNEDDYKAGRNFVNGLDGSKKVPYSALDKRSYIAKLGATFGDHRFVLSHLQDQHRGERLVREEFATFTAANNPRLSVARQSPSYRETTLNNTNLEYIGKNLGFINELTANAYLMKNKRYSADDSGCGYCGGVKGPTTTVIKTQGANVNFDSFIGEDILVKYGVNYRNQEIEPHTRRPFVTNNPEKTDTGAYVEMISGINDFTFTTGLRYDYFDMKANDGVKASDGKWNPSVGLIYQVTPELSLSANHNYASRSPRLYDALMVGIRRVSVDPNLEAEHARNTEIGFNYNNGDFTFEGSYFWQKVNNLIVNPQARHDANGNIINGVTQAVNDGYSKNHGYELNASYRYEGLTARLGVSESKPRFYLNDTKANSSLNPEFAVQVGRTWTAGLAYRFEEPSLELGWKGRYVEDEDGYALANADQTIANSHRDSYINHDFYVNWKPLKNDSLNVNLALNNAFNKFYYPHSQRGTTLPAVGRDFRLNVNYTF
ncbi:TonB-dependent siderophore receptor [Actinobacillus equuli]|uniref:TonB-dependent siderophore receptor n=1 Tax=Actinobacillus equuli TaxID=718 RepID=UPI002442DB80|nr:TonB-dependent siderophore receptor [Actinobacillus equuli]WGE42310.1 TonB-dependent siderophore receptor [Actinobacillus equuli subsp. haemolyticus]WGE53028.1 TonB-dependent siderophore receptor [Actinobacillus equuli subsp. haemolyticus]WGE73463.1 TonB-dependent siderophore receptor [Actinobacillus equuli subsp. haemolyticus]WGE85669.1 TonB-dependent siderophore receptor [Actinobacillus equuli subsp. haemolyticus]